MRFQKSFIIIKNTNLITNKLLLYFAGSRIYFLLLALLAVPLLSLEKGYLGAQIDSSAPYFAWIWANFDGRHFLSISLIGYHNTNFAYFPLYPLLIYLLSKIAPFPQLYGGIIISLIAFLVGLYFLKKVTLLDYSENTAQRAVFLCCFSPLSFYYQAVYADSLFFLLSILAFYFARRKNWIIAGVFCALSILTRLSGIALLPALFIEWYLQSYHKKKFAKGIILSFLTTKAFLGLVIGSLGLLAYMIYLQVVHGDFLLFQKSMSAWGQAGVVFPLQVVFRYLKIFISVSPQALVYWIAVLEFVSMAFCLALSWYVTRKVRVSYGVFMFILLFLVPFTGTFAGTPRYILHLFPAYLGLALLTQNRYKKITLVLFIILGAFFVSLFTRGYFIG